jgi:hypothetical protein
MLRNWIEHKTEANHDDLGYTTKISEEIKQGVDSSAMMNGRLIHKHYSLII